MGTEIGITNNNNFSRFPLTADTSLCLSPAAMSDLFLVFIFLYRPHTVSPRHVKVQFLEHLRFSYKSVLHEIAD